MSFFQDQVVAVVVATEVPPVPIGDFTAEMIDPAIRAVCAVIWNRAHDARFPQTPVEVVLQKGQFSAVCRQDYWIKAMAGLWEPRHVARCVQVWMQQPFSAVFAGEKPLWYYSPVSMIPQGSSPSWAAARTEVPLAGVSRDYFRFLKD